MAVISINDFGGMAPRIAPHALAARQAELARNCRPAPGRLEPRPADGDPLPAPLGVSGGTLVKTIHPLGNLWLAWAHRVDATRPAVAGDHDRLLFSNLDAPRETDRELARTPGPIPGTPGSRLLGVPAPLQRPVACPASGNLNADSDSAGVLQARSYCCTFVTARGEEGPPSPPSALVRVGYGQQVDVFGLTPPPAERNIARRRVYRTLNASQGSAGWYLAAELDAARRSFTDAASDAELGEELASGRWHAPLAGLRGLTSLPGGFLAGFHGNRVLFSEPFRPWAWPPEYAFTLPYPVRALGVFGSTLVAATSAYPYLLDGTHPASMSVTRLPDPQACASAAGMASSPAGVVYPSPDGLYLIGPGGGRMLTRAILDRQSWQDLHPHTMAGAVHDGAYVAFVQQPPDNPWTWDDAGPQPSGGGLGQSPLGAFAVAGSRLESLAPEQSLDGFGVVLDMETDPPGLAQLTGPATAVHRVAADDSLYLARPGAGGPGIQPFAQGQAPLAYTWRSKVFRGPAPLAMAAVQVEADLSQNNLEVAVLADGTELLRTAVTADTPLPLPAGIRAARWQVELSGTAPVSRVRLATSASELKEAA